MTAALIFASTATTVVVSIAASAVVSLLVAGGVMLARSGSRSAARPVEGDLSNVVGELNERIDRMSRELSDALESTREESRRTRAFGELGGSIDFDEVVSRTLDAAGALPGVDAALISIAGAGEEPVVSAVGMAPDEIEEHALGNPRPGRLVRSFSIAYEPGETGPGIEPQVVAGLAVPIPGELETLGLLSVFSRAERTGLADEQLRELEVLARRAGPALENARRFREARYLADLDALTELHNRRYFHETLAREVSRAQRYNRRLALVVFDLDDFKVINDQFGHLAGDSVLADVAERVRSVVRSADVACRVGGDEFAVILPESTLADAEQLYRRILEAMSARPIVHAGRLLLSAGIAELRAQDEPTSFFQRADAALYRAKGGGKGRVAAEDDGPAAMPPSAISGIESASQQG